VTTRGLTAGIMIIALGLAAGDGAAAVPAPQKCAATKLKAAGKKIVGLTACASKAAKQGAEVDPACIVKAETAFGTAWAKVEAKGGCATTGDAAAVEGVVDDELSALETLLFPPSASQCESGKLKAAGKSAACALTCAGKAVVAGAPIDAECAAKCAATLATAFAKSETKGDCTATGDAAAVGASADGFAAAVVDALPPTPCYPGATRGCYDGPDGTAGVGVCAAGTSTCDPGATAYGACVGETTPVTESCATPYDDDCDGVVNDGCAIAVSYATDVEPILQVHCAPCHTTGGSGGANLASSYADTQLASYYCPGKTKGGCTIVRVQNGTMPAGGGCTGNPTLDAGNPACLSAAEQATLSAWIAGGQLP
jgi:hypothetical protein